MLSVIYGVGLTKVLGIGPSSVREEKYPFPSLAQGGARFHGGLKHFRIGRAPVSTLYITDLMEYAIDDRQVPLALFALLFRTF